MSWDAARWPILYHTRIRSNNEGLDCSCGGRVELVRPGCHRPGRGGGVSAGLLQRKLAAAVPVLVVLSFTSLLQISASVGLDRPILFSSLLRLILALPQKRSISIHLLRGRHSHGSATTTRPPTPNPAISFPELLGNHAERLSDPTSTSSHAVQREIW
jgi:hypothetical protein